MDKALYFVKRGASSGVDDGFSEEEEKNLQ